MLFPSLQLFNHNHNVNTTTITTTPTRLGINKGLRCNVSSLQVLFFLNFFDYTNTYLQQVDDHNNHNDMLVRHHHVQQRQRQQRGIARAKGDDWYVLFFCFNYINVLLIKRLHTYASTTVVSSCCDEDKDDADQVSRSMNAHIFGFFPHILCPDV